MKIIKGTISSLASEGIKTLQVPECVLGIGEVEFQDCPDDWFVRLSYGSSGLPLPSSQGFLHLSVKGFEANKELLKEAFEGARGVWADFEKEVEAEFSNRRRAVQKEIERLRKKISKLELYLSEAQ